MFLSSKKLWQFTHPSAFFAILTLFMVIITIGSTISGNSNFFLNILLLLFYMFAFMTSILFNHYFDWVDGVDQYADREQAKPFYENEAKTLLQLKNTTILLTFVTAIIGFYFFIISPVKLTMIIFAIIFVIACFGYSYGLKISKTPIAEIFNALILSIFLFAFTSIVYSAEINLMLIYAIPFFFLILSGNLFVSNIDSISDKIGGRNTLAIVLGINKTQLLAQALAAFGTIIILFYNWLGLFNLNLWLILIWFIISGLVFLKVRKIPIQPRNKVPIMSLLGYITIFFNIIVILGMINAGN